MTAHSLLFSKSTKGTVRLNVPIRLTNRYQQYYMPSQHMYCGRVWNLIQVCDVQSIDYTCPEAASWRKRLGARLPPLGSRVRVSVPPRGFRGGRNRVWVGFSRGFSRFPLPQISFHHFSTLISSISFYFIRPCDGASGVVGRHPCYSRTYNMGASSYLIPRPDLVLDIVEDIFILYMS